MAASLAITGIAVSGTNVNLDSDTGDDFIVLGDGNFHTAGVTVWARKSGGGSTITVGKYGSTPELYTYNDSPRLISWTGGTPNATGSSWANGCYDGTNDGGGTTVGGGYTITVPASTTKRRLRFYWGTWACRVTVQASLSDSSASPVSNTTTIDTPSGGSGYVEIEYEAGSASQTLLVNFFTNRVDSAYGNTTLQAATLKAIGAASVSGAAAWTEANDTAALAGSLRVSGSPGWTEANDAAAVVGSVRASGTSSWTEASDTAALSGVVGTVASGAIAWTEANDTAALAGSLRVSGGSAWTESNDSCAVAGSIRVAGSPSWTEANDTASISGFVGTFTVNGGVAWAEADDVASLTGFTPVQGVEPIWAGPYGKKRRGGTESYLERLLGRPLDEAEEEIEPDAVEVIEQAVQQAPEKVTKTQAQRSLKEYGLAYKEAYVEIYLELVQRREDEEVASAIAALL